MARTWVRSWWPAALWAAAIFVASSLPGAAPRGPGVDKLGHAAAYAVLGVLVARGLAGGALRHVTVTQAWAAVLIATLYGVADECHQAFVPTRSAEARDVVADAAGAVSGAGAAWAWSIYFTSGPVRRRHVASIVRDRTMSYENLVVTHEGPVAIVTINRPAVLNALNARTMDELRRAMLEVRHDPDVRVVVLTGAGDRAFVAGADIAELAEQDPAGGREMALKGQHVFDLVEQLGKPVIAAIHGFALGGGCELAMACTFRIAADTAKLGQPEINLGVIPGYAGTQRLVRLAGRDRAMDLILTGRHVSADEAFGMGLVTRVVPAASLMDEVRTLAAQLASKAPLAVRYAMDAVNRGTDMPFRDGCALEATLFGLTAATEDMREGTRAFLEKRKPAFRGR